MAFTPFLVNTSQTHGGLEQEGFRWRLDDNDEANASWKEDQDVDTNLPLDTNVRLRVVVNAQGVDPSRKLYQLEFRRTVDTAWAKVVSGSGRVQLAASGNITAGGEDTTPQLTAPSGKTAGADFQTGRIWDDENGEEAIDLGSGKYTELEWCIVASSSGGAAESDVFRFRVTAQNQEDFPFAPAVGSLAILSLPFEAVSGAASPPTLVSRDTDGATSGTSLTMSEPAGCAENDILVVWIATNTGGNWGTTPTGWAQILSAIGTYPYSLYWIRRGASEPSDMTFQWTSSVDHRAIISAYRGCVNTGNPYDDVQDSGSDSANPAEPDPPAATVSGDNRTSVVFGFSGDQFETFEAPAGYANFLEYNFAGGGEQIMIADKEDVSTGTENPAVFNMTSAGSGAFIVRAGTLILKP